MQVSTLKENNCTTFNVSGRVDTTTAPELEKVISENLDDASEYVIDVQDMPYISSAGLRVLLKTQKAVKVKGGSMKLIHVNDDVMEVFDMTGFSDILTIE